jgi:hypothetical protein
MKGELRESVARECPHCGAVFETRHSTRRFCSRPCSESFYAARRLERDEEPRQAGQAGARYVAFNRGLIIPPRYVAFNRGLIIPPGWRSHP